MDIVCLDLEGVLIPEVWIAVAERTGIEALKATTRDIPDYNVLMRQRLSILAEHGLTIGQVQKVIDGLSPLEGAKDFCDWLRSRYQLVILSDTFYEFAQPFMRQLGWPTLFCHRLVVDDSGNIIDYQLRMPDHKRSAVAAFKQLNFTVIAAGDSFNDTSMLGEADAGFFFRAPDNVTKEFPAFATNETYGELREAILDASHRLTFGEPQTL